MKRHLGKYKLVYTKNAARDIKKIDRVARKKIKSKIEIDAKKPLFYSKKMISFNTGQFRWRIGNFRVIFDIVKNNIIILKIGHRREVYR